MSAMMDVKTDDWTVWGIAGGVLLTLVGFVMVLADTFGGGGSKGPRPRVVKCSNEACSFDDSWSHDDVMAKARERYGEIRAENQELADNMLKAISFEMMDVPLGSTVSMEEVLENSLMNRWGNPDMAALSFTCPDCSQNTVYNAFQCKKCKEIFFPNLQSRYPDKCPKCSYSRREEYQEERRKKK